MKSSSKEKKPDKTQRKPKPTKKEEPKKIDYSNVVIFAVDSSFRCPGFATFAVVNKNIVGYSKFHLNNKTNETKDLNTGQILYKSLQFLNTKCIEEIEKRFDEIKETTEHPECLLVREKGFNSRGSQAEIKIFEMIGVLDIFAALYKANWYEIYPVTVKKQIAGTSKASKEEVAAALKKYVGEQTYDTDDESDATAVGIAFMLRNNIINEVITDVDQI